ncbi:MAG: hypothetical protein WAW80_00845 [Candidatus Saccharimonadales bacterium]
MKQRGDTIVEVIFAVTVFSLVAVGGLSIMNQGTAMAQRSLEIGLVRDQMDAQADALRYLHSVYVSNFDADDQPETTKLWQDVALKHAVSKAQALSNDSDTQACKLPSLAPGNAATGLPYGVISDAAPFALDIRKLDVGKGSPVILLTQSTNIDKTATYAQVRYTTNGISDPVPEGIWIQSVYSPPDGSVLGYYDFHIRACWLTPGQSAPVTLGTIVRLYEPKT